MLVIQGERLGRFCDRLPRRNLLKIGALGLGFGGLTLADLLRAEAASGVRGSRKAIINIHLEGGPPQMDMWDMKPGVPSEYGGELRPISTRVPGTQICELMPRLAKMADRYSLIRSVVGNVPGHTFDTTQYGYPGLKRPDAAMRSIGGAPAVGSVIGKLLGSRNGMPPFVWDKTGGSQEVIHGGYLGPLYQPFQPDSIRSVFQSRLKDDRLQSRVSLLKQMDRLRRDMDTTGQMEAMDAFGRQAVEVLQSGKLLEALDLNREDPKVRERYTAETGRYAKQTERFLLARRLVQAGVRCVSLNWGGYLGFDSHSNNYPMMRGILPLCDAALAALIEDLHQTGLIDDVMVVAWGEFGRSPKLNNTKAGRDHWPPVQTAMMFGGGLRTGQVVGTTDRYGGEANHRPVHVHEIISTLYHHLGIDPERTQLIDPNGRPRYLVDHHHVIGELL